MAQEFPLAQDNLYGFLHLPGGHQGRSSRRITQLDLQSPERAFPTPGIQNFKTGIPGKNGGNLPPVTSDGAVYQGNV